VCVCVCVCVCVLFSFLLDCDFFLILIDQEKKSLGTSANP
jgi:hypothetical protein